MNPTALQPSERTPTTRRIPVLEPSLRGNERRYVDECLRSGWISSQGPFVERFEREFAQALGVDSSVAVCNGTAAMHLALAALGVGPGDEVIVPDLTFAATINSVLYCGAKPVLVDVDRRTWNIDPAEVERAITSKTRAIVPVHLYGQPAAMDDLMAIARGRGLFVVEDAAQALGTRVGDRAAGTIGDASAFSLFSNKMLTTGEGGMVVFRDHAAEARARVLRDHGMTRGRRYWHEVVGYNYRLTSLQAAVGVAQLERLDHFVARKRKIAAAYRNRLAGLPGLVLPARLPGVFNSHWAFSMIVDAKRSGVSRDDLMTVLDRANVETRPIFFPLHIMPPYRGFAGARRFDNAEWLSARGISLPSGVGLGRAEIDHVCGLIQWVIAATSGPLPPSAN